MGEHPYVKFNVSSQREREREKHNRTVNKGCFLGVITSDKDLTGIEMSNALHVGVFYSV